MNEDKALTSSQDKMIDSLAKDYNMSTEDIKTVMNVAFPELKTVSQYRTAFTMATKYDLDPLAKEIYAYVKDNKMVLIVAAAGFSKIARKQEGYIQLITQAVFPSDDFEIDMVDNKVKHILKPKDRKADEVPLGAYAILRMDGKPDQIKWVEWSEYAPAGAGAWSPWKKQKSAMISKCALTVLCREAFGLSGLYGEEEMDSTQEEFKKFKKRSKTEREEIEDIKDEKEIYGEIEEETETPWIDSVRKIIDEAAIKHISLGFTAEFYDKVKSASYTESDAKKDFILLQSKIKNGNSTNA